MSVKSTRAPARRKTKSVTKSQAVKLTPKMIYAQEKKRALEEWEDFCENGTKAEWKVVGHLKFCEYGGIVGLMKESRRLLGESIAKCKVIPFPVGGKRGIQIAKGA